MTSLKVRTTNLALTTVFAALYAVLVFALAGMSFQIVQVRVADALIPLSMVFGWPAVLGVTIGGAIANVVSPLPSLLTDITLGSLANLIAGFLAWKIGDRKKDSYGVELLGCVAAAIVVTFFVGTYLAILTQTELWLWWLGIGIGSAISMILIGYPLVQIIKRLAQQRLT